jgi:hypothetical protein
MGYWFLVFIQVTEFTVDVNSLDPDVFCFSWNIFVESFSYGSETFNSFYIKYTLLMIQRNFLTVALR